MEQSKKMKYIVWEWDGPELWAYNQNDEELGYLSCERVGGHMHWCWYQMNGIRMSPGCLQDVRYKQIELFQQRKK